MATNDKPLTPWAAISGAMNPEPYAIPSLGCPIKLGCLFAGLIPVLLILNCLRNPFGAEVIRSERPMSLAEARAIFRHPYPDSAKNIRYAHFREWIGYETFLRFEAPVEDCLAFAEKIIADSHAYHGITDPLKPQLNPLKGPVEHSLVKSQDLKNDWFDIENIHQGLESRNGPSHSPKVWIDTERGVCYIWEHD